MKGLRQIRARPDSVHPEASDGEPSAACHRPGDRGNCRVWHQIDRGQQRSQQRARVFVAGGRCNLNRRSNSFRLSRTSRRARRTPGTVSARGISRTACRTNRSRRTRGHSPSIRPSSRRFSAGASLWRRLAGTTKRSRKSRRTSESRRSCCRGLADTARLRRCSTRGGSQDDDAEVNASALLTSAWLLIEQKQYARALEQVRAAETALADPRKDIRCWCSPI